MTMTSDERKKAAEDFKWELEDADREKFLSLAAGLLPEESVEKREGETKAELYLRKQRGQEARELAIPAAAIELYAESLKPTPGEKLLQTLAASITRDVEDDREIAKKQAAADKAAKEAQDLLDEAKRNKAHPSHTLDEQITRSRAEGAGREATELQKAVETLRRLRKEQG